MIRTHSGDFKGIDFSRPLISLFVVLAIIIAIPLSLFGQAASGTATISGLVTDPSGAVIVNADVTVRNVATNVSRVVQTNESGRYEVVALQPGEYEVRAAKPGFATLVRTGIVVAVGERAAVDLPLRISTSAETVTVSGNTSAVETEKTEVSTVVNTQDIMNLPINGRRWDTIAMSTPGASNDGGFGLISFRGMSGLYNNNMVDGMDNNQAFFSEAKGRTRLSYALSMEAVQEYQVGTSNFSAQYGRSAGGILNAVTKSGTNDLHGTFFYLIRDDSLNAANPVGGPQLIRLGLPVKPQDRRQQFGPSAGGHIIKDKLFYFLSYDQQLRNFPAVIIPNSSSFLTSCTTSPGCGNVTSFYQSLVGPQARQGNQWLGLGRIDWNATPRNQISTTVNILRWDSPNGIQTAPTHANHASANGSDGVNDETVVARWTATITPSFISELRFEYGRDFEFQQPNAPGPSVGVTNGINFGMPNFLPRPAYPDEKRWQVSQNLNWLHGRHSVKFGFDVTRVNDQIINLFQGGGVYSFSTLNNFAFDCANPAFPLPLQNCQAAPTSAIPSGTIVGKHYTSFAQAFDTLGTAGATEFNTYDMAYYVEDTWRPTQNLTFNLGLRYELQTMPSLKGNPDLPATTSINTDTNNFGPRVGLSWDPLGDQKTVIRAGVGMYYGRTQNSTISNLITNNGIRFLSYSLLPSAASAPVFPNVLSAPPTGAAAGKTDAVFAAPDFVNPLIYQSELSIEHEFFNGFTLSAVYMGTRGQHMPLFVDTNEFAPTKTVSYSVCSVPQAGSSTTCPGAISRTITVPYFTSPRPNPNYGYLTEVQSAVNTWYNGLVIQAKKRFSHGFQLQASFTYSKAQDNDQNSQTFTASNTPLNPFNIRQDYALSDFDQRKRFSLIGVWQLPGHSIENKALRHIVDGFQLSGILLLAEGHPYSGTISGNGPAGGTTFGILGAGGSSRVPDIGRNTYTYPGTVNLDMRLAREIKFTERFRWQLIFEAFNVANHVQITGLNTTQYNVAGTTLFPRTDFQTISAAGTNIVRERQLQLGTRFIF